MPAPVYLSQGNVNGLEVQPESRIQPGVITRQAAEQFGQAAGGLGQSLLELGKSIQHVNRQTTLADRQTSFLTGIDSLQQEFQNDADPTTAPQRFKERADQLLGDALKGLPQQDSAELNLKLTRQSLSYTGAVRTDALKKQADSFSANTDTQYESFTRRFAQAGSDTERNAIAAEFDDTLNKGVTTGMMTAKSAEAYRQSLRKTGETALVLREIGRNPAAAQSALENPAQYAGLDPVQREQLAAQARAAASEMSRAALEREATFSPATAALKAGMVVRPEHAGVIFDKIIQQESGGNPNAQSGKGAAGLAQIMPDTARMLVKQLGVADWSGDSDAQVRQFLKEDPELSRKLGLKYFSDNLATFNGQLAPAIAAYHAGPAGLVKKAHEAALGKYGEGYSAQQFLEFLPATLTDGQKATGDYVRDIYKRMGMDISQPGLSGMASFRASNTVGSEIERQRTDENRILSAQVSVAGRMADEFAPLFEKGYMVNPERLTSTRAMLELGTARGDATAADKLRHLNEAEAIAPIVHEAYGHRPEELEAATAAMRQQLAIGGDATPAMAKRLKVFEAVQTEMAAARRDNPIALAERQGMPATPINIEANPNDPAFARQIAARGVVSTRAQQAYGGEHQFFRPEERVAAKARFESMGENERFSMLKAISDAAPNDAVYRAAVKEMTGNDKLAATAGMFMRTNPDVAQKIIRGSFLLEQDGVKPKLDSIKDALKPMFNGQLYISDAVQADLLQATLAVYASDRGKNGTLWSPDDTSGLRAAAEQVTGKVATLNGRSTPLPRTVTAGQAQDLMFDLQATTLDAFGGAYTRSGEPMDARFVGRYGRLIAADTQFGDHRKYMVVLPQGGKDQPVFTKDLQPLIIDLPQAITAQRVQSRPNAARMNSVLAQEFQAQRRALGLAAPDGM